VTPVALTMGEPAGIAPEITAKAWAALHRRPDRCFFLIGDLLHQRSRGRDIPVLPIASPAEAADCFADGLPVLAMALAQMPEPGKPLTVTAPQVLASIELAVDLAMQGAASAVCTNPIGKATLYDAGFAFQGHTDFLADLARRRGHDAEPVMMLAAKDLRTVPVTVHIALKEVPSRLTGQAILAQARIVARDLKCRFGIAHPRLAVTGLNPHAGEGGAMGREEEEIIVPAIAALKSEGLDVTGPLPADTAFHDEARAQYDAILCMYHDQALIPVKTLDFHGGVNVTLGLPFVRTSPDHGTALTLAGTGKANPRSLIAAIELAHVMAAR
jgi:4-hydroxythreonine-4-phosphate dehydrogenase